MKAQCDFLQRANWDKNQGYFVLQKYHQVVMQYYFGNWFSYGYQRLRFGLIACMLLLFDTINFVFTNNISQLSKKLQSLLAQVIQLYLSAISGPLNHGHNAGFSHFGPYSSFCESQFENITISQLLFLCLKTRVSCLLFPLYQPVRFCMTAD